jgi:hypothetical protein
VSYYLDNVIDRLAGERDEAREALRATEAALQAVTALHVAWTELAIARGEVMKAIDGDTWHRAKEREIRAENALVKLGVAREAL